MLVESFMFVLEWVALLLLQLTRTGLSARAESESDLQPCGGTVNTTEGVIRSPNYPDFYTRKKICRWSIISTDAKISLLMLRYDLVPEYDRIMIYDSILPGPKEPITIEAPLTQRLFVVGPEASVVFVPNEVAGNRRFLAWFSSTWVNKSAMNETRYDCGDDLMGAGDVVAPGFSLSISDSAICAWTLRPMPSDAVLRLEVINSNLSTAGDERLLIYGASASNGGLDVLLHVIGDGSEVNQEYIIDASSAVVVFIAEREKRKNNKSDGTSVQNGGSIHVRFSSEERWIPTGAEPGENETNKTLLIACLFGAAFAVGATVAWLLCRRRCSRFATAVDDRTKVQAIAADLGQAATESDVAVSGWLSGADDISSVALSGFVFGGLARPSVLLLGVIDTRHRAGVARSLTKILSTLGGCDVHDALLVRAGGGLRPESCEGDAHRSGGARQLRARLLAADRVVVLASAGALLIAEAARSGRVYARCFRSAAAYFSVSDALGLCGRYPQLKKRTLLVTCCDEDERVVSEVCRSDGDNSWLLKEFSEDIDTAESHTTSVGNGLNAAAADDTTAVALLPRFRLVDDLQRLVGAVHGAAEQERLVWSCAEEFQECGEARELERHVAAVRRCASDAPQLFLATCGPVVDCEEILQGRSAALPLSICESRSVHHDHLTDVISLLSIVPPSAGSGDRDNDFGESSFITCNAIGELACTTEMNCLSQYNYCYDPFGDVVSVLSITPSGDDGTDAGGDNGNGCDGHSRLAEPQDRAPFPIDYSGWQAADLS